jgi:hypothetical protein
LDSWYRAAATNGVVIATCGASTVAHMVGFLLSFG